MSYLALARKYRPQTFEEVVGQEHVTGTLMNAIKSDKVAHAYLFSGPRGVGKTTTARILAKALNCEKGPATKPCNACNNCIEITKGSSLDIQEIDGASNRGIDDIRTLRANVKFVPASSRYKVYIIDEVHQITKEAFNALLKTLEEPPAHVIFVMATTEPEKIPATILSRSQKFSFKLITQKKLFLHLKEICSKENVIITDDALMIVVSCGQGRVRDAMSILDQVISYTGKKEIKKEDVIYILGIIPEEILIKFSDNIINSKVKETLDLVNEVIENGYDIHQLIRDLRTHFRNMLIVKAVGKDGELLALSDSSIDLIASKAKAFKEDHLLRIIDDLSRMHEKMKWSEQSRTVLEIGLFQLCQQFVSIDELIEKITKLENALGGAEDNSIPVTFETPTVEEENNPVPQDYIKSEDDIKVKNETTDEKIETPSIPEKIIQPDNENNVSPITGNDDKWRALIEEARNASHLLYESLVKGAAERFEENILYIAFHKSNKFNKEAVERKASLIKDLAVKIYGKNTQVKFLFSETAPAGGSEPLPDMEEEGEELITEELLKDIKETDPVAGKVIDVFKGKIVYVKKKEDKTNG